MDFSNPVGSEKRAVKESQREGQPTRIVSCARTFATTQENIWAVLTNAERIPNWFLPISGDLKLGGRYQLEGHASGEIVCCESPEALDLTWECGGNVSWVTLRLEPAGEGTQLTLEHIMLQDEEGEKHWKKFGPGATGVGWDLSFAGLGMHLESDEAIAQEESHAWMASDPGKEFIRRCAKAWGESHVESGESVDVANMMAEETAKAYTGE